MDLGILQGRLLPPVDGLIQEFPKNNWEDEFDSIKSLGLNHIEWIITKKSFNEGVLELDISKYSPHISSICCDNLIDKEITNPYFLSKQLKPICEWAIKNGINAISIPLLEDSGVTPHTINRFRKTLSHYGFVYPDLEFHFELEADYDLALNMVTAAPNFFLIYDTGNITSCGYDHEIWLTCCSHVIKNVHLKDRTINPIATVKPFTGDTNFDLIFKTLSERKYKGKFTIQTAREIDGGEYNTIKKHITLFKDLYNEKFI